MASHNREIKIKFLETYKDILPKYCVLGESPYDEKRENTSDLDLAIDVESNILWESLRKESSFAFCLICKWEYDHGCFATFWLKLESNEIAQVDFMTVHKFANRFRINPKKIILNRIKRNDIFLNCEKDAQVYRYVKSLIKGTKSKYPNCKKVNREDYFVDSDILRSNKNTSQSPNSIPVFLPWKLRKLLIMLEGLFSGRLLRRFYDNPGFNLIINKDFYAERSELFEGLIKVFPHNEIRACKGIFESFHIASHIKLRPSITILLCVHKEHFPIKNEEELTCFWTTRSQMLLT